MILASPAGSSRSNGQAWRAAMCAEREKHIHAILEPRQAIRRERETGSSFDAQRLRQWGDVRRPAFEPAARQGR